MMKNRMHSRKSCKGVIDGCIKIGNNVFVGSNTTIQCNVRIDNNVVIGAGSHVYKMYQIMSFWEIPARFIGNFDGFVKKRISDCSKIDQANAPEGEKIPDYLTHEFWDKFSKFRISLS